ncbi:DUF5662 family protein [uncultured Clostridium sp.]|uniref:DUF5662 family protein n=1 Tax=uncultured Clostridium sp. TaxID=59620 RepID=UPI002635337C|nr:DUF5662 family protein [uncultured Clostridium sp.]
MLTVEEQEQNYRNYIDTHRANVRKAYEKVVKPYAEKYLSPQSVEILDRNIEQHDEDKDIDFIFQAYRKNHFPVDEKEKESSKEEYNIAWNYHKKVNPHHWEFFLDDNDEDFVNLELIEEEEEIYKLAYLEMIADWLSFTFKLAQDQIGKGDDIHTSGDSLEFDDWYNKNRDTIKIHPQLQEWFNPIVQEIIKNLKEDNSVLYEKKDLNEGIIRAEKYREDNNTFLINTPRGTLAVNLDALTFKIKLNYEEGTLFDDKELTRVTLKKLLDKYKVLKKIGAKVMSIAEIEKDMKENPNRYNFEKEIEIMEQEREENKIFTDNSESELSQAIFSPKESLEGEGDYSIYED